MRHGSKTPLHWCKPPACGVGVDAGAGDVDPIGAKLPGTGLKAASSGVDVVGAESKEDATGAQAGCAGAELCTGAVVGGTGVNPPCTGVNAPASGEGVDAAAGNVDPTGAKLPGTGLKAALSGVDVAGAESKEDATGAQAVCAGASLCTGAVVGDTGAKPPCTGVNALAPGVGVDAGAGDVHWRPGRLHRGRCHGRCSGNFRSTASAEYRRIIQCRTALTAKLSHCLSPSRTESISLVHLPAIGLARLLTRQLYTPVARTPFQRVIRFNGVRSTKSIRG